MTGASVSTTLRIQVLKLLLHDRAPAWVAVPLQRTPAEVVEIAEEHGWPNKAAMAELLQGLERQLKRELQPPAATHSPIPGQRVTDPLPTRDPAARADGVLQTVPIGKVIPDPNNPRDDVGDVSELAASMLAVGLLQPIVCRPRAPGRFQVVAGHRRLAAAQSLGWSSVEIVVRSALHPDDVLAAMLIENSHRRDLDPIEEARALRRIQQQMGGPTIASLERVAARVGLSGKRVGERMLLLSLSATDQEAVRSGRLKLNRGDREGPCVNWSGARVVAAGGGASVVVASVGGTGPGPLHPSQAPHGRGA